MSRLTGVLHASGGLVYHLRALRWRASLWAAFCARTGAWLRDWEPAATELLVVGPSAGYTLDPFFLARFTVVHAIEPDPLARWLLRQRFRSIRWHFVDCDPFSERNGLSRLAARFPASAILFSNVLGQLDDTDATIALIKGLRRQLAHHHWASYHDLLSAPSMPSFLPEDCSRLPLDPVHLGGRLWRGQRVAITDHGTAGLADTPPPLAVWPLTPTQWQVVAWTKHPPEHGPAGHNAAPARHP